MLAFALEAVLFCGAAISLWCIYKTEENLRKSAKQLTEIGELRDEVFETRDRLVALEQVRLAREGLLNREVQ